VLSDHDRLTIFYALEAEMHRSDLYTDGRWIKLMEFRNDAGNLRSLVNEFCCADYNPFWEVLISSIYEICCVTGKNNLELQQEACS